jgi:para-aminobenzoate synthetase component 1
MVDDEISADFKTICKEVISNKKEAISKKSKIAITPRITKSNYIDKVNEVLENIKRGNIYEANFCQEFYAENSSINPFETYNHLNEISKPPFASFLKIEDQYALCASPERYLKKEGGTVISQPIKGTAKRHYNSITDKKIAKDLSKNTKEIAENVMIVDLVRNDLSKSAIKGSVRVEELCKVYPFKQVHQMISTIVANVPENTNVTTVLKDTFPMGSMTGAPKIKAMKIIENLEETKRGLYSGAIGYFTPENDFDFNVVIRSILYNEEKKYISYSVGSAITAKAIPEKEYEECLLKAEALKYVLLNTD